MLLIMIRIDWLTYANQAPWNGLICKCYDHNFAWLDFLFSFRRPSCLFCRVDPFSLSLSPYLSLSLLHTHPIPDHFLLHFNTLHALVIHWCSLYSNASNSLCHFVCPFFVKNVVFACSPGVFAVQIECKEFMKLGNKHHQNTQYAAVNQQKIECDWASARV